MNRKASPTVTEEVIKVTKTLDPGGVDVTVLVRQEARYDLLGRAVQLENFIWVERLGKGREGKEGKYSITRRRSHVIRLSGQVARVAHLNDRGHCMIVIRR